MKDVVGFEGLYKVTSCGKIWSCRQKKWMKPYGSEGDYKMICLTKDGVSIYDYVHRIVAKAYIPNPHNYPQVNHKDEVRDHNWWTNLEWCTRNYNLNYGTRYDKLRAQGCRKLVPRAVYCVELDKTFPTGKDAAKQLGLNPSCVSLCCNGKLKTSGGYHFRFAD